MMLGQGSATVQAGPLLDRAAANPAAQTAAFQPVKLSDEMMDGVSAGLNTIEISLLIKTVCSGNLDCWKPPSTRGR